MPQRRSETSLGDLARAVHALRPADDSAAAAIAATLGLALRAPEREDTGRATADHAVNAARPAESKRDDASAVEAARADAPPLPHLVPVATDRSGLARPWDLAQPLEAFDASVHLRGIEHHDPLLDRRWSRQILASVLATPRRDSELDAGQAVEVLAAGRPLDPLPYRVRQSLSRGAQVLLDIGHGMEPFSRDAWTLVREVEGLLGRSQVDVRMFDEVPGVAGGGPVWTWDNYKPPGPGVPVIALSDVGLSRPEGGRTTSERAASWLELGRVLAGNGSAFVLFVPYPPQRWPRALAGELVLVQWDRPTTVRAVHARRGEMPAITLGVR